MKLTDILSGFIGWTITHKTNGQIELRKKFKGGNLLIIANRGSGYDWKWYGNFSDSKGINLHIATNGPLQMTWADWAEVNKIVERTKSFFEG